MKDHLMMLKPQITNGRDKVLIASVLFHALNSLFKVALTLEKLAFLIFGVFEGAVSYPLTLAEIDISFSEINTLMMRNYSICILFTFERFPLKNVVLAYILKPYLIPVTSLISSKTVMRRCSY